VNPVGLFSLEVTYDRDAPAGYRAGAARTAPLLGGEKLGLTVYELPPGESVCPYHYELGCEEWLIVLSGRPTLRTPEGEQELEQWDIAFFPEGEAGAHKVTNRTHETLRVAIWSTKATPAIVVYPDSQKAAIWPQGWIFRLADAVDYWDGELST
jgi:uncharacterized cupin superfamily protein